MEKLFFGNIKGVNELTQPELLDPQEVPYFLNGVLNRNSGGTNAVKRGSWTRDTGFTVAGNTITGFKQLLDEIGNPYWVGYVNTALQMYNAGWSNLKTGLTASQNFKFARYNDYNIISNGVDNLFILGGTAFANVRTLEITRPNISNVSIQHIVGAGGSLSAQSQYRYILVYASDEGDYSPPSQPMTHYTESDSYNDARNSTGATEKALYLHNLPISSDARVTRRLLFRTEGSGKIYYLRKILDNVATFYEDSGADIDLDFSESITYINVPQFGKNIVVHRDRLFVANLKYEDLNVYEPVHSKNKGTTTTPTRTDGTAAPTYEDGKQMYVFPSPNPGGALQGNSNYKWRVDFVDNFGRRSKTYVEAEYQIDTTVNSYYAITRMPECNIGSAKVFNPECYTKRLWRTEGDGSVFYLVDTIKDDNVNPYAGSTGLQVTYQDNMPDATLITNEQWTDYGSGDSTENPLAFAFSEIGKPTVFPLENYREVFADEGGEITGIFDDVNGILIFKDRAIFKLYTNGAPINWRLDKLVDGVGCTEPNSIAQIDNIYIFKQNNRIYQFTSGGGLKEIGLKFRASIESILTVQESILTNDWYLTQCTTATGSYVYVYDRLFDTWYKFTRAGGNCLTVYKHGASLSAETSFYTNYGAYVVKYVYSSETDNESGTNIDIAMGIKSKTFRFADGISKARLRKLFINFSGYNTKQAAISIVDAETLTTDIFSYTATSGWQTKRSDISGEKKSRKVYFQLGGAGMTEFNSARLEYRQIGEGFGQ